MRTFAALYQKELKATYTLFLFLMTGTAVLDLYILLAGNADDPKIVLTLLPHAALVLVTPFLLAYQYTQEWSSGTGQFLFSLPVPLWHVGAAKFLAVLTLALLWFFLSTLGTHLVYLRFLTDQIRIRKVDFWVFFGASDLSLLLYLLGIAIPATTIRWVVKRFRWVVATLVLLLLLYITVRIVAWLFPLLSEWFPPYHLTMGVFERSDFRVVSGRIWIAQGVALGLIGLLWGALGLWIMERFTEF